MKNKLLCTALIFIFGNVFTTVAQKGKQEGEYYVVSDTVNGRAVKYYYDSQKDYLKQLEKAQDRVDELQEKKRLYESNQRTELADKIEEIDQRVQQYDNYTIEQAQKDKELTAQFYAEKINAYNKYIDAQIAFESTEANYTRLDGDNVKLFSSSAFEINFESGSKSSQKRIRTTSGLTLAFGYNFIEGDNLGINDFSYSNNNYFAIGVHWLTALNKSQTIRFRHGIEYQTQGTELNGNRSFTIDDPSNTQIQRLAFNADKAKFRQDQLVFPLHIEIGGTNKKEYDDGRVRYDDYDKLKIGIGGYAGFNMSSRLKYKFESQGNDVKQTTINAFDNNVFLYGADAYVGYGDVTLFGRMALNDIFDSGSVDGQYAAFGLRFQW